MKRFMLTLGLNYVSAGLLLPCALSLLCPLLVVCAAVTLGTGILLLAQWGLSAVEMLQAYIIRKHE